MEQITNIAEGAKEFKYVSWYSLPDFRSYRAEYKKLLLAVVNAGGKLGFHLPVNNGQIDRYLDRLEEGIAGRSNFLFVYTIERSILASAQIVRSMFEDAAHSGEVVKVMVNPKFRKNGVGYTMMRYCDCFALNNQIRLLYLTTCTNSFTVNFYRKCGYQIAGEIPGYLLESDGSCQPVTKMYKHIY